MINGLTGFRGVVVTGGMTTRPYINMSNPSAGMVRYNGTSNNLEVYDGSSWLSMPSSHATVELDAEALSLIDWARKKRNEEYELENLARDNPTINDLVEQIKTKQHQLKMVQTLIKNQSDDAGLLIKPSMIP